MTRRLARVSLLTVLTMAGAASIVTAHDAVKAVIIIKPGQPRAGEICSLDVSVLAPPGMPVLDQIEGVRIVAEMTGHNMTPVEAKLAQSSGKGGYQGTIALTMGGPWQLALRIKVSNEEMWALFPVEAVRANEPGDAVGMRYVVQMRDPVRASLLPPWWVVGGTLILILLVELTAILLNMGRSRRASRAAAL